MRIDYDIDKIVCPICNEPDLNLEVPNYGQGWKPVMCPKCSMEFLIKEEIVKTYKVKRCN